MCNCTHILVSVFVADKQAFKTGWREQSRRTGTSCAVPKASTKIKAKTRRQEQSVQSSSVRSRRPRILIKLNSCFVRFVCRVRVSGLQTLSQNVLGFSVFGLIFRHIKDLRGGFDHNLGWSRGCRHSHEQQGARHAAPCGPPNLMDSL